MVVAGISYNVYKGNLLMLAYETTDYEKDCAGMGKTPSKDTYLGDDDKVQAVWQIKF